jgi:peptide deformylase
MSVIPIVKIPAQVLSTKCDTIREITPDVKRIAKDLLDTFRHPDTHGVGLAAPQLGHSLAMCAVVRHIKDHKPQEFLLINPKITKSSTATDITWEGCLSIPDLYCRVQRSKSIAVEYIDLEGKPQKIKATGFFARVIQHEFDHLQGVLITDKCIGKSLTEKGLDEYLAKEKGND